MAAQRPAPIFYGWWIVAAAFLNLFFSVGIVFYGFPVLYPALVESLGFTRAQVTQGFLLGFLLVGLPVGVLAGAVIDRVGARGVILVGVGFVGTSLLLMGTMTRLWQYELLCMTEVIGYVLAGPIANQVLVARWFRIRRGRAMGYAYLGLGLGGVSAPLLVNFMVRSYGWRHAVEIMGLLVLVVLLPVGIWITRSGPEDLGLRPDGALPEGTAGESGPIGSPAVGVGRAVRTSNFWLILVGSTLVMAAIGSVVQHFILFLEDTGYPAPAASRFLTGLLLASLGGRVVVGHVADRFARKTITALFYALLSASLLLLGLAREPAVLWSFVSVFGFAMGADYMLIPLVTAECFGTSSLGKLLGLIIMGYSVGQWVGPWIAGRIFDARHGYDLAWYIFAAAGILGAAAIYAVHPATDASQT